MKKLSVSLFPNSFFDIKYKFKVKYLWLNLTVSLTLI